MKNYKELYRLERTHWWFVGRQKILQDVLSSFIPGKVRRALDIGSSTGAHAPLLQSRSKEVLLVEMSSGAALLSRKSGSGATVLQGTYPGVPTEGKFGLVTFFDVLEHMENDVSAVRHAEGLLEPGGFLVCTVPAFDFLWSEHDVLEGHYRRYRKQEVRALISQNTRLKIRRLSYFNITFFLPVVIFRTLKNLLRIRTEATDIKIPLPVVNNFAARLFGSERWPLRFFDFPFGVSLICVAQKIPE